jgi:hypothetical protein
VCGLVVAREYERARHVVRVKEGGGGGGGGGASSVAGRAVYLKYKSSTPIGRGPSSEQRAPEAVIAVVVAAGHTLMRCKQEHRGAAGVLPRPRPARRA